MDHPKGMFRQLAQMIINATFPYNSEQSLSGVAFTDVGSLKAIIIYDPGGSSDQILPRCNGGVIRRIFAPIDLKELNLMSS